jgi:glycosyltransferase involved in cell wall biosynthesis
VRIVVMGGLARSLVHFRGHLLRRLVRDGHDVVACAGDDDPSVRAELSRWGIAFAPVRLSRTGRNPLRELQVVSGLTRLLRDVRPDVFFGYTVKPVIYGGWAAAMAGVPRRIALITGLGSAFLPGNWKGKVLERVVVEMYRSALARYDHVVFQNPDDCSEFRTRRLVSESQVARVSGTGIDLNEFALAPLPSGAPRFLMIARLLREKGIAEYAEATRLVKSRFPGAVCRLLGPIYDSPCAIGLDRVRDWEASCGLEYFGETDDVRPFLRNCNVYVLPSYREGVPRSTQEALAMGRPVITTDVPGCRETVEPGHNGLLVPAQDSKALADAMMDLAGDPCRRQAMGLASRRLAETRFDVHQINDRLARLIAPTAAVSNQRQAA